MYSLQRSISTNTAPFYSENRHKGITGKSCVYIIYIGGYNFMFFRSWRGHVPNGTWAHALSPLFTI